MMMNEKKKQPLLILTGPTAVGKTDLSIALAKKINGAVISADSMQVYRGMDIGSAKDVYKRQGFPGSPTSTFRCDVSAKTGRDSMATGRGKSTTAVVCGF